MNTDLDALRAMGATCDELEVTLTRLQRYRNEQVRRLFEAGHSAIQLGKTLGFSRGRIYQIIHEPESGDEYDYANFADHVAELWADAFDRWESAEFAGSPDDYFNLGEAVSGP
jgi:hypothetical protein